MIQQISIDEVNSLDISEVIGKYITLNRKGANYHGQCPFHKEKTPSFSVSPAKGIYKCFGCGKAGNSIGFVMEFKQLDFISAVKAIANDHNIIIHQEMETKETRERFTRSEQLYSANKLAQTWFAENLREKENATALEYAQGRWNDETIADFGIGFAPDKWDGMKLWAKTKGISESILVETGLLSESNGKFFDSFRNRLIFPIFDRSARIVGFTGRDFFGKKDTPKYFNTRQTEIFTKGKILYGYHLAIKSIKEHGFAYMVEGNADVIRMHQIGIANTVGAGGTSLTRDQISELKSRTDSLTLIGDSDKAGQAAVIKNGKMIIESGLFCNVIELPNGEDKQDPDSFFTSVAHFDTYATENIQDYIIWQANSQRKKCNNPDIKSKLINELSFLISKLPVSSHDIYIEQLSGIIKPKKAWEDRIRQLISDEPKEEKKEAGSNIPQHVILSDYEKYGFYEDENRYFFRTKDGPKRGCNFIMEPLFHIASVINSKRLYKITNEFGFSQVIELQQKDLISLSNFKLRVESLGNFLFEGMDCDLNKLKRFLYEKTQSCFEIVQLGWQKDGFWAWSNGIYSTKFIASDYNGIVKFSDKNYYLPSSSDIYKSEDNLFVSERRFKFTPSDISLNEYATKLITVFGDNAIFGLCFYFASLFRDHIAKLFGFFPILNLFGPKGAGKTELAISLLQFFGHQGKGPNITNTTKAALADHIALFSNSCCHIDEYTNSLEYEKIEFLKGLWDGTGRTRMNMDKDKKKETTHVDCGIMLSGQHMPTADIALYSRLVFLAFCKVEYSDLEKAAFNELKELEKLGLSHITHELLQHRKLFTSEFMENYKRASDELNFALNNAVIEDRIFRNWLVILASYRTFMNVIRVPWEYRKLLDIAAQLIKRQNQETKKSNELSIFWGIVEFLTNDGLIREDVDFRVDFVSSLKTDLLTTETNWHPAKNILFLNHSRIFQLYRVHGQKTKENILPLKTLEYYLMNSKEYLGRKLSVSFKVEENKRVVEDQEVEVNIHGKGVKKVTRRVTTAMAFDYDMLQISILNVVNKQEIDDDIGNPGREPDPF
ncbi:MAG: DNA primase [Mariniphaga sp.]